MSTSADNPGVVVMAGGQSRPRATIEWAFRAPNRQAEVMRLWCVSQDWATLDEGRRAWEEIAHLIGEDGASAVARITGAILGARGRADLVVEEIVLESFARGR